MQGVYVGILLWVPVRREDEILSRMPSLSHRSIHLTKNHWQALPSVLTILSKQQSYSVLLQLGMWAFMYSIVIYVVIYVYLILYLYNISTEFLKI